MRVLVLLLPNGYWVIYRRPATNKKIMSEKQKKILQGILLIIVAIGGFVTVYYLSFYQNVRTISPIVFNKPDRITVNSKEKNDWNYMGYTSEELIKDAMQIANNEAHLCYSRGGHIMSGFGGDPFCVESTGGTSNVWPRIDGCGGEKEALAWVVFHAEDPEKWDFTIECRDLSQCNGPENAICNSKGCQFLCGMTKKEEYLEYINDKNFPSGMIDVESKTQNKPEIYDDQDDPMYESENYAQSENFGGSEDGECFSTYVEKEISSGLYVGKLEQKFYVDNAATDLNVYFSPRLTPGVIERGGDVVLTDPKGRTYVLDPNSPYYLGGAGGFRIEDHLPEGYWHISIDPPDNCKYFFRINLRNGIHITDIRSYTKSLHESIYDPEEENSYNDRANELIKRSDDDLLADLGESDMIFAGYLGEKIANQPGIAQPLISDDVEAHVRLDHYARNQVDAQSFFANIPLYDNGEYPDRFAHDGYYVGLAKDLPIGSYSLYLSVRGTKKDPPGYFEVRGFMMGNDFIEDE